LAPAAVIYSFASGQRSILFAHQAQKEYFFSLVVSLVSLVGIGVPLVLRYEGKGMAVAFVISLTLTLLYRNLLISRLNSAKIKKIS
jgi:O-antigen/teichoic acid export membrane protein